MRKSRLALLVLLGLVFLFTVACTGYKSAVKKSRPSFVIATPVVVLTKGAKVAMYGTGFQPKEELTLVFKNTDGGLSGISAVVKPAPVPNSDGVWASEWDVGPYLKVIKAGTTVISVVDKDWNTMVQAPVLFVAPPKKEEPKKK
ncbi:MAG: hypothetical protein AB1558_12680 [Thermodesulfobacteriota bacterium]